MNTPTATLLAGVPNILRTIYHRIRFRAGDPAVWIEFPDKTTLAIVRDVELPRARRQIRVDAVHAPADFTPPGGLSPDRPIATAQAAAECLRLRGVKRVRSDRSLPFIFVDEIRRAGIDIVCDHELGVLERRSKDAQEVEAMRTAQRLTEDAIRMACEMIASAETGDDGVLRDPQQPQQPLTSELMKSRINHYLALRDCYSVSPIVAGGPVGADCHHGGAGPLRTGEPIIIDVFPCHTPSGYYGDCTRSIVHGHVPAEVARMHATVKAAKQAAFDVTRVGATGETVHRATIAVIEAAGYRLGFPPENPPAGFCSMQHGTGHGLGLDLKEPPLLDFGGPPLVAGDAITIEPGLYAPDIGGIRIEDLVIVREEGFENLNRLHEGLDWRA